MALTLDTPDRARIENAIQAAERRTRGEIVPVVVARSSHYADGPLRGALLGAGLATVLAIAFAPLRGTVAGTLAAQAVGLVAGYALASVPWVLRALVGKTALNRAAYERALRAFLEYGLAHTAGRTGVLVFTSLFEHRVIVLGDEAINAKMGQPEWEKAVATVLSGIARGALADGVCEAIALIGDRLAEHFPITEGDIDELPNQVHVE